MQLSSGYIRMVIAGVYGRCFDRNKYPWYTKADIVNDLGRANGYSDYLEVATSTTGHRFAAVSKDVFSTRRRALYNVPTDYADGLAVDYASHELSGEACLKEAAEDGELYDVVFLDPYHSYEASRTDLESGLKLLRPDGVMVVHDCNPPKERLTSPVYQEGDWMGETYLAFLDFVRDHGELAYCVVDADWGVGLAWRAGGSRPLVTGDVPAGPDLGSIDYRDWNQFDRHRKDILRLISARTFKKVFL